MLFVVVFSSSLFFFFFDESNLNACEALLPPGKMTMMRQK